MNFYVFINEIWEVRNDEKKFLKRSFKISKLKLNVYLDIV